MWSGGWWAAGAVVGAGSPHAPNGGTIAPLERRAPGKIVSALPTTEGDMTHSAALISTEELARRLGAPGLRVFDCTTYLKPRADGGYDAESGRANYDKGHIPGAAFLDLGAELSQPHSRLRFTLPPLDELAKAFAAKGIGHGTFEE